MKLSRILSNATKFDVQLQVLQVVALDSPA